MKKTNVMIGCIIVMFILLIVLVQIFMNKVAYYMSFPNDTTNFHSYTKAICGDDNYCIDVLVNCNNNNIESIKPIGEGIHFSNDWKDIRPIELIKKWC
jgi:uncharacterized membrane protein YvbJ